MNLSSASREGKNINLVDCYGGLNRGVALKITCRIVKPTVAARDKAAAIRDGYGRSPLITAAMAAIWLGVWILRMRFQLARPDKLIVGAMDFHL